MSLVHLSLAALLSFQHPFPASNCLCPQLKLLKLLMCLLECETNELSHFRGNFAQTRICPNQAALYNTHIHKKPCQLIACHLPIALPNHLLRQQRMNVLPRSRKRIRVIIWHSVISEATEYFTSVYDHRNRANTQLDCHRSRRVSAHVVHHTYDFGRN